MLLAILITVTTYLPVSPASTVGLIGDAPPLVLQPIAKLGPGAGKEISGLVASKSQRGVFWTLNDSGDEPRVYPIRLDGQVIPSVRYPELPGVLIGGAINGDWEDIAIDSAGRLIVADCGNNSNARADLTLYIVPEPEATEGRTTWTTKIPFRYPDQRSLPAAESDRNFDCEAVFTINEDIYLLSKDRSDTFTKLYRVDERQPGVVNTLTYLDRFDVQGMATGADASADGLKLAILTYDRLWLFERRDQSEQFFAGRVLCRPYRMVQGDSDSESICFEDPDTLLIADECRAELYRVPLAEIAEIRPFRAVAPGAIRAADAVRVMSFNIRYGSAADGPNAWRVRRDAALHTATNFAPDILGLQEVEAAQADWLRESLPSMAFHGAGRIDGESQGEFAPILYLRDRFTFLAGGHFWVSPTPDAPGSKGWDAACERMASWVRLLDRRTNKPILVLNTHLDHVGVQARQRGLRLIRERLAKLAEGAEIILTGDFNTSGDGPDVAMLLSGATAGEGSQTLTLRDTFRSIFPIVDRDEATFRDWTSRITGDRIDWIVASKGLEPVDADIVRRAPGGRLPSDHYPVTAILRWAAH